MKTRRTILKTVAGAVALPVLPSTAAPAYTPKALRADEMPLVAALVDVIIPRTGTPGASDAGVPAWIDLALTGNPDSLSRFRQGLRWADAEAQRRFHAPFAQLNAHQQTLLLTPASTAPQTDEGRFFTLLKNMTVDAYYTSREGLEVELGYHGNTYLPKFDGCTHPEHQG